MKEFKNRNFKLFYITVWSFIFIFSLFLLFRCIVVFGSGTLKEDAKAAEVNVISAACNYMIHTSVPILDYISKQEEGGNANVILNTLAGTFPINRYVEEAGNFTAGGGTEEDKSLLLNNSFNLLFHGNSAYNSSSGSSQDASLDNSLDSSEDTSSDASNTQSESSDGTLTADSGNENGSVTQADNTQDSMPIDIIKGDVYLEDEDTTGNIDNSGDSTDAAETLSTGKGEAYTLKQLENRQFLYKNFYIVDSATVVTDSLFDAKELLAEDMKMKTASDSPQILIYHTHSQESYIDSKAGEEDDTVVGVGTHLAELLTDKYGFNVMHDKTKYDLMGGYLDRNLAYNYAAEGVEKILKENPSIEVVIDVHRDGVSDELPEGQGKRVSSINGTDVAEVMLFNGLSRNAKGEIARLENPYLQDNLAFSLQLQLKGREMYPGLMFKNYLNAYRYNLHLRKKSLLAEVGTNRNTVEEAKNAMDYFASVLYEVLVGE